MFKAAPYFVRHEAEVFSALISLRSKYPAQSQITTSVEAISEEYLLIAEPKAGIDAIVNLNLPLDNPSYKPSTQSLCTSLTFLADLVKTSRLPTLEPQLERLGELAIKV